MGSADTPFPAPLAREIELLVEVLEPLDDELKVEFPLLAPAPARSHGGSQLGFAEMRRHSFRQLVRVPPLDEETAQTVLDEIGKTADPRRDDGLPGRHVLHDRKRAAFVVGAADGDVERGDYVGDVAPHAEEEHIVLKPA